LNIFENNVNEQSIFKDIPIQMNEKNKNDSLNTTSSSLLSNTSKDSGSVKLRIATAKKK
jgi:hypothetical protein